MTGPSRLSGHLGWLSAALAGAVVVVAGLGIAVSSEAPSAGERAIPTSTPQPTSVPTPDPSRIPFDCADIYTRDWDEELKPIVLNPSWATASPGIGTSDDGLRQLLRPHVRLTCQWGKPSAASDTGLVTSLAQIDAETDHLVRSRLNALGWTCFEFASGVRCVMDVSDANGSWGESHFLRDGVWVATRWSNLAPDGYTADIAYTLWK